MEYTDTIDVNIVDFNGDQDGGKFNFKMPKLKMPKLKMSKLKNKLKNKLKGRSHRNRSRSSSKSKSSNNGGLFSKLFSGRSKSSKSSKSSNDGFFGKLFGKKKSSKKSSDKKKSKDKKEIKNKKDKKKSKKNKKDDSDIMSENNNTVDSNDNSDDYDDGSDNDNSDEEYDEEEYDEEEYDEEEYDEDEDEDEEEEDDEDDDSESELSSESNPKLNGDSDSETNDDTYNPKQNQSKRKRKSKHKTKSSKFCSHKCNKCKCKPCNCDMNGGETPIDEEKQIRDTSKPIVHKLDANLNYLESMIKTGIQDATKLIQNASNTPEAKAIVEAQNNNISNIPLNKVEKVDTTKASLEEIYTYLDKATEERNEYKKQLDVITEHNKKLEKMVNSLSLTVNKLSSKPKPVLTVDELIKMTEKLESKERIGLIAYILGYEYDKNGLKFDKTFQIIGTKLNIASQDKNKFTQIFSSHYNQGLCDFQSGKSELYNTFRLQIE